MVPRVLRPRYTNTLIVECGCAIQHPEIVPLIPGRKRSKFCSVIPSVFALHSKEIGTDPRIHGMTWDEFFGPRSRGNWQIRGPSGPPVRRPAHELPSVLFVYVEGLTSRTVLRPCPNNLKTIDWLFCRSRGQRWLPLRMTRSWPYRIPAPSQSAITATMEPTPRLTLLSSRYYSGGEATSHRSASGACVSCALKCASCVSAEQRWAQTAAVCHCRKD